MRTDHFLEVLTRDLRRPLSAEAAWWARRAAARPDSTPPDPDDVTDEACPAVDEGCLIADAC